MLASCNAWVNVSVHARPPLRCIPHGRGISPGAVLLNILRFTRRSKQRVKNHSLSFGYDCRAVVCCIQNSLDRYNYLQYGG